METHIPEKFLCWSLLFDFWWDFLVWYCLCRSLAFNDFTLTLSHLYKLQIFIEDSNSGADETLLSQTSIFFVQIQHFDHQKDVSVWGVGAQLSLLQVQDVYFLLYRGLNVDWTKPPHTAVCLVFMDQLMSESPVRFKNTRMCLKCFASQILQHVGLQHLCSSFPPHSVLFCLTWQMPVRVPTRWKSFL